MHKLVRGWRVGSPSRTYSAFDPEAWLRGPGSVVLEQELERERRPEPFGGPSNAEMGAEDDVLLPLTLPKGAPTVGSSAPSTPSEDPGVASAVLPAAYVLTRGVKGSEALPMSLFLVY